MVRWLITLGVSIYKWSIWVLLNQIFGLLEVEGVQIPFTTKMWTGHENSYSGSPQLDFKNWLTTIEKTTKSKCAQPLWVLGSVLPTGLSHLMCEISIIIPQMRDQKLSVPHPALPSPHLSAWLQILFSEPLHSLRAKTGLLNFLSCF